MLDVRCAPDGEEPKVYSVFGFARLDENEQERLRLSLYCLGCGGRAYFRRASSDGKAACFGSLYHKDDCPEYRPSAARKDEEAAVTEVQSVLEHDDGLHIDFDAPVRTPRKKPTNADNKTVRESKKEYLATVPSTETSLKHGEREGQTESSVTTPRLGLKKLLLSLLRGSELAGSDLWVYTDAVHRWRAKNLFVNFADAEPTENGAPRMYWGTISHSDKDMNWLNSAENRELGIAISDIREPLKKRFNLTERRDLEGAAVILFGKCFYTKDKSRKIIKPWSTDPKWVYLLPSQDE
ncbi:hypothetical protein KJI95_07500 [Shewanella sp. JM162201]|uniref:Uncharacterized protein n=1 Tax=Shewanella jiangmenensis TaxID=2837387 RepID=A0ABS5V1L3_9GAMM|nr:hypothetical protein [Shewanella jiangmenensis]MBT1444370.1 hypothetical protein [Shewanella jiangmenensis]